MEMTIDPNEAECLEFRFDLNAGGEILGTAVEQLSKNMQRDIILAAKKISNAFVDTGNLAPDVWWEKHINADYSTLPVVWCMPYALEVSRAARKRADGSYAPGRWHMRFTVTVQRWQIADPDGFAEFWNEMMSILNSNRSEKIKIKLTAHINTNWWEVDLKIP